MTAEDLVDGGRPQQDFSTRLPHGRFLLARGKRVSNNYWIYPGSGAWSNRVVTKKPGKMPTPEAEPSPISILVADGKGLYAQAIGMALWWWPSFEVLQEFPATGFEAVKAVTTHRPEVALIDFAIPEMDGPAAAAVIHQRSPDTKVILMSDPYGPGEIEYALAAGAVGLIPKTAYIEQVADVINRAHSGESPVNAAELQELTRSLKQRQDERIALLARMATLTPRELEVLRLLSLGKSSVEISEDLGITQETVTDHFHNITKKVGARSREQVVSMARLCRLITT